MKLPLLAVLLGAVLAAGAVTAAVLVHGVRETSPSSRTTFRGNEAPPGIAIPQFALRDQNRRTVNTEDLRGKVVVLTFLESKCTRACPIIAVEIGCAWKQLTPDERGEVMAVAISANPRDDTPESIRRFLARNHASHVVRYLSGPVPAVRELWRRFQILSSLESGNADTHSAPVRIYSRGLVWLGTEHPGEDLSPANLVHDIRVALGRS